MDRAQWPWVGAALAAVIAAVALGVASRSLPEPRIPAPEPFPIAEALDEGTPRSRRPTRAFVRPGPETPRTPPEGAHVLQANGLSVWDVSPGQGEPARPGQVVVVEYSAFTQDGTLLDATYLKDDPLRFVVGGGRVLPGMDQGVRDMRPGGERQLVIPPQLGFGARGIPKRVPPDATLTYEMKLLDVLVLPVEPPAGAGAERPSGLRVLDVVEGAGAEVVAGRKVVMDYVQWLAEGPVRIDTSLERPAPVKVEAGAGLLLPGWDEGLLGMKEGGHRKLVLPPALAFGAEGKPPSVPPNATLVLEVFVRRVE